MSIYHGIKEILNKISTTKNINNCMKESLKFNYKGNYIPMSTDSSVEYVINVLKSKNINNIIVSDSIQYNAGENNNKEILHIENCIDRVVNMYNNIINKHKKIIGVYTALNVVSERNLNTSHQNWLYMDFENMKLIRFEPDIEYDEFKMSYFCDTIIKNINKDFTYVKYENIPINVFSGCRSFSTMLVLMHIENINFNYLSNFYVNNKISIELIKPYIYLLDYKLSILSDNSYICKIKTRKNANIINFYLI